MHGTKERAERAMREKVKGLTGRELGPIKTPSTLEVADLVQQFVTSSTTILRVEAIPEAQRIAANVGLHHFHSGRVAELKKVLGLLGQEEIVKTVESQVAAVKKEHHLE